MSGGEERVVAIFRFRLRRNAADAFQQLAGRMFELASAMPGFISFRDYANPEGEGCALVEFSSEETMTAWREHPEHRAAQERGRQEFFEWYEITVWTRRRGYSFTYSKAELSFGPR